MHNHSKKCFIIPSTTKRISAATALCTRIISIPSSCSSFYSSHARICLSATEIEDALADSNDNNDARANNDNNNSNEAQTTKNRQGKWKNRENHRKFFDGIASRLGVQTPDDWYRVRKSDVEKLGGSGLLARYYQSSLSRALASVYPEIEWHPWRFPMAPVGFWSQRSNQRRFFEWAAKQLNIRADDPEGWYNITTTDIEKLGGSGLLSRYYGGSLVKALEAVFPELDWQPWRFSTVPLRYWLDLANQRKFCDWMAKQLSSSSSSTEKDLDQWYRITNADVEKLGASGLLNNYYGGSLSKMLAAVYPEIEWQPWRFQTVPHRYWEHSLDNQRKFFDWCATQLGVRHAPEDWYRIKISDVEKLGGAGLLSTHYGGSLMKALMALYPHLAWEPWRFEHFKAGSSSAFAATRHHADGTGGDEHHHHHHHHLLLLDQYMEYLAKKLHIQHLDDWYRVSLQQLRSVGVGGGSGIIAQHGGLFAVLKRLYPNHNWNEDEFHAARGKKSSQRWLATIVRKLYPDEVVVEEYTRDDLRYGSGDTSASHAVGGGDDNADNDTTTTTTTTSTTSTSSGELMRFDVFIPRLSLAFEYQGEQHFQDVHFYGPQARFQRSDEEKMAACTAAGIMLVTVPYWWDRTPEALSDIIRRCTAQQQQQQQKQQQQQGAMSSSSSGSNSSSSS